MSYSEAFLSEMKKRLLQEKSELELELSKMATKHGSAYETKFPEDGEVADENAQEVTEYSNELSLTQTLRVQLEKVETALKKLDDHTYGQKADGEYVDEARLEANPAAGAVLEE